MNLQPITQKLLRKTKTEAFLCTNLTNIRYLTGLQTSVGALLISRKGTTLFIDGRYTEMAQKTVPRAIALQDPEHFSTLLLRNPSVAFEADDVTVSRLQAWKKKFPRVKFSPTSGLIEKLRRVKSASELLAIRRACFIARKLLRDVPRLLAPGISEKRLAFLLLENALHYGSDGMAFDTIVGFGENTSKPHHHPTSRKLRVGDVVQIDLGVRVDGYCSDCSRVFVYGDKNSEQRRVYTALQKAKKAAEKLVKPGVDVRLLDRTARGVLEAQHLAEFFPHSLGHGLGLDIHERPSISKKSPPCTLLRNEVITIEPGVYFPGVWGMRIEDTIIVS